MLVVQRPSAEEIAQRYEEWMKIVADNKISPSNSWDLALIDYFYDLSVLKDGETVNFQKASCALDGCMKIYTSRVDSVATEAVKLLSGLTESVSVPPREFRVNSHEIGVKRTKRSSRNDHTLANELSSLTLKHLELARSIDPLFKKTLADYTEGGARGLLLNHLGVCSNGRIIFDASDDTMFKCDLGLVSHSTEVDILSLRSKFLSDLDGFFIQEICPSLQDFELASEISPNLSVLQEVMEGFYDNEGSDLDDCYDAVGPVDFRDTGVRNQRYFEADAVPIAESDENIYSYFDTAFMANWAGPEHWRLARVSSEKANPTGETVDRKSKKQPFYIDFRSSDEIDQDELFVPLVHKVPAKPSAEAATRTLLPEDIQFSSRNILSLFTRPQTVKLFEEDRGVELTAEVKSQVEAQVATSFANNADAETGTDLGGLVFAQPILRKAEYLHYARTAKKVDIKKLKGSIWKELATNETGTNESIENLETSQFEGTKKFTDVVKGLKRIYPEKKRNDISVSFCFICLLHLANEKNLLISNTKASYDLDIRQGVPEETSVLD
ncbi:barren-domain-containing protein [Basidiobolus meristosporus CBS 931.73]|uniref:Condensin complex subunit 2 n=1 Tax=Basidiobolus meristosporus CBS 931.73 TaxID=1314790 RepID=A0A1Y1YF04_9FUNG|nr:barren-domain-containing protein [Basidiobolus meristosporus CBS 931.73]|eukprot:ORX96610.1 barren-domain-containing protein [Basidiobolus meristosporus CBS 931.73]